MNRAAEWQESPVMQDAAVEAALQIDLLDAGLTSVDAGARDALNEWLSRRGTPQFRLGAAEVDLAWVEHADANWHVILELQAGTHRALLALDGLAAFDPLLVGEPFMLMPPELRDLALHRLAARALMHAPAALANSLELRAVHWSGMQLPDRCCRLSFVLRRRDDGTQVVGSLWFETSQGLKWLHEVLPVDEASAGARLNLAVPLRLALGQSTITARSLQELAAGDVVWIENASIARSGVAIELTAPAAHCKWRCRAHRHLLRIVDGVEHCVDIDTGLTPALQPAPPRQDITGEEPMEAQRWQMEVPVTFDLGELPLRMGDLERLQPGQIIELPQDVATAVVALRVAGRCVAEGTLIAIGKRLGVRIRTIIAQREAGAA